MRVDAKISIFYGCLGDHRIPKSYFATCFGGCENGGFLLFGSLLAETLVLNFIIPSSMFLTPKWHSSHFNEALSTLILLENNKRGSSNIFS